MENKLMSIVEMQEFWQTYKTNLCVRDYQEARKLLDNAYECEYNTYLYFVEKRRELIPSGESSFLDDIIKIESDVLKQMVNEGINLVKIQSRGFQK